jgi:transcriptional regulator with XRE-family HTH domain
MLQAEDLCHALQTTITGHSFTMPRRKRTQLDHNFIYGRWKVFGEWLTMQRNNSGLTQREAARAVKISRQQWMRYESGTKVLRKRMPAMAKVLGVPLEKMLDRAGYRASPKRNAAKDRLGRIYNLLCAGAVDLAILELLRLNDRLRGGRTAVGPRVGGVTATKFARAVVLLDELPDWLLDKTLKVLQERTKSEGLDATHPSVMNLIWKNCGEALRSNKHTQILRLPSSRRCPSANGDVSRNGQN